VKLHTVILKPADIAVPLPFLIQRTPYGVDGTSRASFFGQRPELARAGYIYVCQDIRGRYKSEGSFVHEAVRLGRSQRSQSDRRKAPIRTTPWPGC